MLKKSLLFIGLLFVSPIFADDLEYDYVSQKVKPDYIQPFKKFEFRFGVGYDIGFSTYNNKKINYHNSEVSGLDLTFGFLVRPTRHFSLELGAGVGTQSVKFSHNGKKTEPDPADLAYVESLLTPEFFAKVKDAMMTGDLSNVWHLFDWSKLNYDYQGKPQFSEGFTAIKFPFIAKFNYHINNNWVTYIGGAYNKGGLIDDARVFVGFNYKYFDMRVGYIAYTSERFKDDRYARITQRGGAPVSLTIGAVF